MPIMWIIRTFKFVMVKFLKRVVTACSWKTRYSLYSTLSEFNLIAIRFIYNITMFKTAAVICICWEVLNDDKKSLTV